MNKLRFAWIVILFLATTALPADVIHVPGDHPTIQEAVNAANDGDTILVADGTWTGASMSNLAIDIESENGSNHSTITGVEGYGFRVASSSSVSVDGFTINTSIGIYTEDSEVTITSCVFTSNSNGIENHYGNTTISNCIFIDNFNAWIGGAAIQAWGPFSVDNCLFLHNYTSYDPEFGELGGEGGAIWCLPFCSPTITNCTFHQNHATLSGGAIASRQYPSSSPGATGKSSEPLHTITVENCIFWDNDNFDAGEIWCVDNSTLDIRYSDVDGGLDSLRGNFNWGEGMIDADPLFIGGALGLHYLSHTAAGQLADSPCIDSGNPAGPTPEGTTRTDFIPDAGLTDMGLHTEEPDQGATHHYLAVGPGPSPDNQPLVRVYQQIGWPAFAAEFQAYDADGYGVNVTSGDVNGDGTSEIITGAGPGDIYGPHVRGFNPYGRPVAGLSFLAYGTSKWGVNVSCGDLDSDGRDDLITGAGPGEVFGPHVRGWTWDGSSVSPMPGVSFFAYGTPKWGVNVAGGDFDGDGFDEIVTGAGPGDVYGPHVRGWNVDGGAAEAIPSVSYFAYGTLKKGVRVSCGDVDGDGIDEILTGPGPSPAFGAHVKAWDYDGTTVTSIPGIDFFAHGTYEYGVTVSSGIDFDGDGRHEIVTGKGPDPNAHTKVRVFTYDGSETSLLFSLINTFDGYTYSGVNATAGRY